MASNGKRTTSSDEVCFNPISRESKEVDLSNYNLNEVWEELCSQVGSGLGYKLKPLLRKGDTSIFAAYSVDLRAKGFLLQIPSELKPAGLTHQSSRKLEVVDQFSGLGHGMSGVGIFLKDEEFSDLFEILVSEILKEIDSSSNGAEACAVAVRCISRWRLFLEKRGLPLSEAEVRGLIGELEVLRRLSGKFGTFEAIRSWRGPYVEIRDFELPNYSVEVKTCTPSSGATVTINRPEQLDAQDERQVYLTVVTLVKSCSEGATLGDYVDRILVLLTDPMEKMHFWDSLAAAGYISANRSLYSERFAVSDVEVFRVAEGFPRIASSEIAGGVLKVKFDISVSALMPYSADVGSTIG